MTDASNGDGNRYPIGTLAQMAAIPVEARSRFLAEFPTILEEMAKAVAMYAEFNQIMDGLAEVKMQTPDWIDDDRNELIHSLQVLGETKVSITTKRRPS